jgi:hypothetical protein
MSDSDRDNVRDLGAETPAGVIVESSAERSAEVDRMGGLDNNPPAPPATDASERPPSDPTG